MTTLNDVDLEGKSVTAYDKVAAGLAEMRQRFDLKLIPAEVSEANYPLVKEAATTLQKLRTGLDKKRKEVKAPYYEACQLIDSQAKVLAAQIVELEEPWKAAKAEYDEREKIREQKRQAKIQQVFDYLNTVREQAYTMTSSELAEALEQLNNEPCVDAMERAPEALTLRNQIIDTVGELYVQRAEQERMEAENRRLRDEQRVTDEIARYSSMMAEFMDANRQQLENQMAVLANGVNEHWGDRHAEVVAARDKAYAGLQRLLAMLPEAAEPEEQVELPLGNNIRDNFPEMREEDEGAGISVIRLVAPTAKVDAIVELLCVRYPVSVRVTDDGETQITID